MAWSLASSLNTRTFALPSITAPFAYYKLDWNSNEEVSARNWTDTSITYSSSDWKIVQGALFTRASASKINIPAFDANIASNPWSVAAWFKTSITAAWLDEYSIISRRTWTNTFQLCIAWPTTGIANKLRVYDWWVTSTKIYSWVINDWNWHHVVVTSSSNTSAKIYTDWVLSDSSTSFSFVTQSIANWNNIWNFDTWWRCWDWDIDEVWYWGVELTSTEVSALYNAWSWRAYPF